MEVEDCKGGEEHKARESPALSGTKQVLSFFMGSTKAKLLASSYLLISLKIPGFRGKVLIFSMKTPLWIYVVICLSFFIFKKAHGLPE